jgi:hypothetical protein
MVITTVALDGRLVVVVVARKVTRVFSAAADKDVDVPNRVK